MIETILQKLKNKNLIFYLSTIVVFSLCKYYYNLATVNDLKFLLAPTSKLLSVITNSEVSFVEGQGYFHLQHNIMLVKSCAGFNFGILIFIMLNFLIINHTDSTKFKTLLCSTSIVLAYILTILVNTARILFSIVGQKSAEIIISNEAHTFIHEVIGIITYLTALMIIYISSEYLLNISKKTSYEKLA